MKSIKATAKLFFLYDISQSSYEAYLYAYVYACVYITQLLNENRFHNWINYHSSNRARIPISQTVLYYTQVLSGTLCVCQYWKHLYTNQTIRISKYQSSIKQFVIYIMVSIPLKHCFNIANKKCGEFNVKCVFLQTSIFCTVSIGISHWTNWVIHSLAVSANAS